MEIPAFSASAPRSIHDVLDAMCVRGACALQGAIPDLLVEVPHGADQRSHFDATRSALSGDLPVGLEAFFHVNTDVGAWDYGLAAARTLVSMAPARSVLLVRSLIPRTFVDCNRPADHSGGDLTQGALTAGIPAYVTNVTDRAHLLGLHARYIAAVEMAYQQVCGAGGLALTPHTFAPRSVGITSVGLDIIERLNWAYKAQRYSTWPLRPEVDLLTRNPAGLYLAPPGIEEQLVAAFQSLGRDVRSNSTYNLAPGSMGAQWAESYPGQVLCLEVRRDLLVREWRPFEAMAIDSDAVASVAQPLAAALNCACSSHPSPPA